MFYVNGEQLKMDSPQGMRFQEWKKESLPYLKDPVVLKSGRTIKFNPTGLIEPPISEHIPFKVTIGTEEGSETWVYTPVLPIKKKDELIFPVHGRIFKHGRSWKLSKSTDVELIYFMLKLCPSVRKNKIILVDKERDARNKIEETLGTADLRFMVYSPNSPLSVEATGSEDTLRMIASSWGVENVEGKGINEVKVGLVNAVEGANTNYATTHRGYKEFMNETKINDLMVLRAGIQMAIDKRVIVFKPEDMTCRFKNEFVLMSIPPRDWNTKEAALFNMLRIHTDMREKFYLEMGTPQPTVTEKKVEEFKGKVGDGATLPADLHLLRSQDLQKLCKSYGLKAFGVKKEAMIEQLELMR